MGRLTADAVNTAAASITGRATSAINALEEKKSFMGSVFGNNDTVEQTQGALRLIRDVQIPRWKQNGLDIVEAENDDKVDGWVSVGQEFTKAISEIDGYGEDATLQSVLAATAAQTATDIKDKVVPALSFGIGFGVVAVVAVIAGYLFIMRKA